MLLDSLNKLVKMVILDTRGRCFVRTQLELSATAALKVHKIKPLIARFTDWCKQTPS